MKQCKKCKAKIGKKTNICNRCGTSVKRKIGIVPIFLIAMLLISTGAGTYFFNKQQASVPEVPTVMLTSLLWFSSELDLFLEIITSIKNDNPIAVRDVEITCNQLGQSGTVITQTSKTAFVRIEPDSFITLEGFNMGPFNEQTHNVVCDITNYTKSESSLSS